MLLCVSLPRVRTVLTTDTDLAPWLKVTVVRVLVVSPRVTEVLPTATVVLPRVMVVRLQDTEDLPQAMAYLVFRREAVPRVNEVLLDRNAVFHSSSFESFLGGFAVAAAAAAAAAAARAVLALAPGVLI